MLRLRIGLLLLVLAGCASDTTQATNEQPSPQEPIPNKTQPVDGKKKADQEKKADRAASQPTNGEKKPALPPDSPGSDIYDANNQFGIDLYTRLAQKPGNTFFSPYSIFNALAMTHAGARGQTAKEMARALHFPLGDDNVHASVGQLIRKLQGEDADRPFKLTTVNRLWGQQDLKILPDFLRITQTDYQSGLQLIDFKKDADGSRQTINRWVEEQTNSKIKELLKKGIISPMTRLVLTNAIYFKAEWQWPFPKNGTRPEDFTISGSPAFKVPMMNHEFYPSYMETNDFQLALLGYKGNEVSMAVILPKRIDGLADVEKKLSAQSLRQHLASAKPARVIMSLPKFKLTEEFKLNDELIAMGMPSAFNENAADLLGMAELKRPDENLYISAVMHKAFVEVDETSTEAAAATAVVVNDVVSSNPPPPPPPIRFRADHPFLFVIRHNATGTILFMGRMQDPR